MVHKTHFGRVTHSAHKEISNSGGTISGEKPFGIFVNEIEDALFGSKILRNHIEIELLSSENWKQRYIILYRNESKNKLKYLRLDPRKKEVQRNLSVYNNEGSRLPIVPSCVVEKSFCMICQHYISRAHELAAGKEKAIVNRLKRNPIKFDTIFCYDGDKNTILNARERIREVASCLIQREKITDKDSIFYINRIFTLISIYEEFYIPFVELETPLKQGKCFLLKCSVENLKKNPIDLRWFLLTGNLSISIPFEVEKSISNHIMILSPEGMIFQNAGVSNIEEKEVKEKYGNLSRFLDDNMIYFHVPPEDAQKIHDSWVQTIADGKSRNRKKVIPRETHQSIAKKRGGPAIEVQLGISKNFPNRFSLIRILVILMYLSVFVPTIALLVFESDVKSSLLMETLILEVTILVSLGVYALDKTFLHEYIAVQVIIVVILFIIEIALLSHYY